MGKIYRVTVTDESGGTLFELAGPAKMLGRLAPDALSDALQEVETSEDDTPTTLTPLGGEIRPARRPRRTKAQMAEDAARAVVTTPAPEEPANVADTPYNPFAA